MMICFLNIIGYHIFKGKHALDVEIPRTGNQIFRIGIFSRQLISDEVTPVVQIFSINIVILGQMPSTRLDTAYGSSFLVGMRSFPILA